MSRPESFAEFLKQSRREDLQRIWNEYSGLVPEEMLRAFIGHVSGVPQPGRGPVTVLDPSRLTWLYAMDPCEGDKLVFIPLDLAEEWAPVAVAAEIAGTWGRFEELAGGIATGLRGELAANARYPDFESFRDREPNEEADEDDWNVQEADEARAEAGDTEEGLREAYESLTVPRQRGPLDDDPMDRCGLIEWDSEQLLHWFDPNEAMCDYMPGSVEREFGQEYYAMFGEGPFAEYRTADHDAILAAFAELGYTVVRDAKVIETFWGFETDLAEVERRLAAYREAERFLREVVRGAGQEDGDDGED